MCLSVRASLVRCVPFTASHKHCVGWTVCCPLQVLCVKVRGRTGGDNFVTCMRKALAVRYEDNPVGIGGVFQILSGKAKLHVMVSVP